MRTHVDTEPYKPKDHSFAENIHPITPSPTDSSMSPSKISEAPGFSITEMNKTPKEKHNFGAIVTGIDLDNISGRFLSVPHMRLGN